MTDLVERLRAGYCSNNDTDDAADRIEKLEAALRKIKDLHHGPEDDDVLWIRDDMTYKIVCDTLEGEPLSDSEARIIINKARKALEGKDE
jgi:hypothetical protein